MTRKPGHLEELPAAARASACHRCHQITCKGVLQGYTPDPNRLPAFLLHLARDVEWDDEKPCFRTLASTLAQYYSLQDPLDVKHRQFGGAAPGRHSSTAQQTRSAAPVGAIQAKVESSEPGYAYPTAEAAGSVPVEAAPCHSNGSTVRGNAQMGGGQDAVEAALAAQRPHPNMSASEPVGDAVVAEAMGDMDEPRLGGDKAASQPAPVTATQGEATGQVVNTDGVTPAEGATDPAVSAANEATPRTDNLRGAAGTNKAEDERAWTIQHVRRSSSSNTNSMLTSVPIA